MAADKHSIRVRLSYPLGRVKEPVLYHLILDFGLIPNIYRANMDVHNGGFIVLDLEGDEMAIKRGVEWMQSLGISISTLISDDEDEGLNER